MLLILIYSLFGDGNCDCSSFDDDCCVVLMFGGVCTGSGLNMGTRRHPRARRNSVRVDKRTLTLGPPAPAPAPAMAVDTKVLALVLAFVLVRVFVLTRVFVFVPGLGPGLGLGRARTPYNATRVALFCKKTTSKQERKQARCYK